MFMCRVFSYVVGRECLLWPACSLSKTLLAFDLLHFVLQSQIYQVPLDFLLVHSSPLWWKGHHFGGVLEDLGVFLEPFIFSFLWITGWGIDLDYSDIEWFPLETNRGLSVIFEIAPTSAFFVDDEGYSISSKGILATVVDIMIIWIKFAHSDHFSSLNPKMLMFTLAISCLTISNLNWFKDLTFHIPMQYCSL